MKEVDKILHNTTTNHMLKPSEYFFVSFSSFDMKYVREIMAALEGQSINKWDYSNQIESIEIGEDIDSQLYSEIDKCTHFIAVISQNSMNKNKGRFCHEELSYAIKKHPDIKYIPVLIYQDHTMFHRIVRGINSLFKGNSTNRIKLKPPFNHFDPKLCYILDDSPEAIVKLTMSICQKISKIYIPPIEAHQHLPFWKLFRKEVEDFTHSNHQHGELIKMLGVFNEYYKKNQITKALRLINLFINTCDYTIPSYRPFYPILVKAICETELSLLDDALESYRTAEEMRPMNQDAIGGKGTVYYKMGNYPEAKNCFEKILSNDIKENKDNARINLIITKFSMSEPIMDSEVSFIFEVILDNYSDDLKTNILNARGMYYLVTKELDTLELHCKNVINMQLHDEATIRLLQLSYMNRGLPDISKEIING